MNSDGMVEGAEEVENGTVTRYWWILIIIPLGLIIGTVTSTCNHLQADLNKDDLAQYRVSEEISKKPLTDDMQKAFDMPDQAVDITLKGISSSNGLNHYLKLRTFQTIDSKYGYYDVVGKNKSEVLALIVPLDESNPGARAAMLGTGIAVMKSVFGESNLKHTLRFVFVPSTENDILLQPSIFTLNDEKLIGYYQLQSQINPNFTKVDWLEITSPATEPQLGTILSHPALDLTAENSLTDQKINLTFQAAQQLRKLLLDKL